jgi:hypothetical protein
VPPDGAAPSSPRPSPPSAAQGYLLGRPVSAALAEQWLVPGAAAVAPADVD